MKEYNNCEYLPLFRGNGHLLHTTFCIPVHISLGIELCILNVIEEETIKLDNEIKADEGIQSVDIQSYIRGNENSFRDFDRRTRETLGHL